MKKIYRDMLSFICAVVFLALAPLVVLYAMGYRLNTRHVDPLPVGVLMVETEPRRAGVTIDGKDMGTTPIAISNLTPGEIQLSVTKDGYRPWQKTIMIVSGVVNEFRHIRLFPTTIETTPLLEGSAVVALAPNRTTIAVVDTTMHLHILDEQGSAVMPAMTLPFIPDTMQWSPESAALILQHGTTSPLIVLLTDTPHVRPLKRPTPIKQIDWDPRIPGRLLILSPTGILEAFNIFNGVSETLATHIRTFATSSRDIYHVSTTGELVSQNVQGDIQRQQKNLTSNPINTLLISQQGSVAFLTADKTLYFLDTDGVSFQVATHVQGAQWSPDGELLLVQTAPHALHVFNPGTTYIPWLSEKQLTLVQRLSSPIRNPQWYAGSRHVLYQAEDQLIITEIDTRDHPISTVIDSTNTGNPQAHVGNNGDTLVYIKRTGMQPILVSSRLTQE